MKRSLPVLKMTVAARMKKVHIISRTSRLFAYHEVSAPALASSIHALYKPVEHARRVEKSPVSEEPPEYFGIKEGHPLGQLTRSPEELREDDFEISRPEGKPPPGADERPGISPQGAPIRTGSMATVRLQRRTRLATKLREVFEVEEIDEVVAGLSPSQYICYAYLIFFLSQRCHVGYYALSVRNGL